MLLQEGTELLVFLIQAAAKHLQEVSLQGIHFSASCLTPIVQALPLAPRLKSLYLDDLGTLPPASLTPLQNLSMLSKLRLRTAAITHDSHLAEVARIPGLADLEISEADNVTDEGLTSLLQSNLSASLTRLVLGSRRMRGHCDHVITMRPHGMNPSSTLSPPRGILTLFILFLLVDLSVLARSGF